MIQYIADAFTDSLFAGNPAAVLPCRKMPAPDYDAMSRIEGRGLVITAKSSEYDFVSRCFYPKLNVPEDPVTGSAHTYLTPLWAGKLGKTEMVAKQLSPRGGVLHVRIEGQRVFITGNAVLFMHGEIPFDL